MANKFTKSVLERQAIEAKRKKRSGDDTQQPAEILPAIPQADIESFAGAEGGIAETQSTPVIPSQQTTPFAPAVTSVEHITAAPEPQVAAEQPNPTVKTAPIYEAEQRPVSPASIQEEIELEEAVMQNSMSDLVSSYLIRTPERIAKNKTFYLDEAVINGIRAAAKKQKVTESKLVNDILRGVLGIH